MKRLGFCYEFTADYCMSRHIFRHDGRHGLWICIALDTLRYLVIEGCIYMTHMGLRPGLGGIDIAVRPVFNGADMTLIGYSTSRDHS
jgi:hypothetical protein